MNDFVLFVGILFLVAGIVLAILSKVFKKDFKKFVIGGVAIGILLFVLGNTFVIIPTGYSGVRTTFEQVSKESVSKGFNWKIPFVQKIELVNNKQKDVVISKQIWGETVPEEKTPVYAADIVVTYYIKENRSAWLFANVDNRENLVDDKLVSSAVKAATVELTAAKVTNRSIIEPLVLEKLNLSLKDKYGGETVIAKKVVINDMDFEKEYNLAIAQKSVAREKQAQQAIENQTNIEKAEADKAISIAKAQANAEAKLIEAEAEAEANRKISASLTDEVLDNKAIDKWDGKVPTVTGDGGTIVDIGSINDGK